MKIHRGDIIFAHIPFNRFNPFQFRGNHFYVIISNENQMENKSVQAVPLTSKTDDVRLGQFIINFDCLNSPSKVLCDQLSLFPRKIFQKGKRFGIATEKEMEEIEWRIKEQLSISA